MRFHPYVLINSFQMAICSGVRSPVLYRCKGTWCVGRGWCISLQPLSIFWVQSQRLWDNSYYSLRLSLTTDESEAADLLSASHLKNSKILVQEGLGNYSETNALLSHMMKHSSREVKGFPPMIHSWQSWDTNLNQHFLTPRPVIFSSICNTVWTLELVIWVLTLALTAGWHS